MAYPEDTLIPALTDPVEWDKAGKVHDWRNYIGENCRKIWESFTTDQKIAIALDAQEWASCIKLSGD